MVLVMESLGGEMKLRPRYWHRLVRVLWDTLQGEDTPPVIKQVRELDITTITTTLLCV